MINIVLDALRDHGHRDQFGSVAGKKIAKRISVYAAILNLICFMTAGLAADYFISLKATPSDNFFDASIIAFLYHAFLAYRANGLAPEKHTSILSYCSATLLPWIAALFILSLTAFAFKSGDHFSRVGATLFALQSSAELLAFNALYYVFIQTRLASGAITVNFAQVLILQNGDKRKGVNWTCPNGTELTGFFYIDLMKQLRADDFREVVDGLRHAVALGKCSCVYIIAEWSDQRAVEWVLSQLGPLPAPVMLLTNPPNALLYCKSEVISQNVVSYELQKAPLNWLDRSVKRSIDLLIAGTALLILSPFMILTAIAIYRETGRPILFMQDRNGFGQLSFKIFKFRTMYTQDNGNQIEQARRDDERITPLGKVLRRTSVDELPQLINVILGDMSIVGPRPHAKAHDDYYDRLISDYAFRHHVKPGITGWAQVNGHRGATDTPADMQKRVEHDIWYINHWSIWLDIKIIFRTALLVFNDRNAY